MLNHEDNVVQQFLPIFYEEWYLMFLILHEVHFDVFLQILEKQHHNFYGLLGMQQ